MDPLQEKAFCPVFNTEEKEWLLLAGMRLLADDARAYARKVQQDAPRWCADNKFVRIAKVQVTELP